MLAFTKCCVSFTTDVTANISNSIFVSPLHRIFSPNLGSGIIENVLANVTQAFMFFFSLALPHGCHFLPSLFILFESWIITLTEARSSLFVVLDSFVTYAMTHKYVAILYQVSYRIFYNTPELTSLPSTNKYVTIQDPFTPSFPAHILSASPIFRALLPN